VWQVFSGDGTVTMNGVEQALERGDVFVSPAWTELSLRAESAMDLFMFSDAPVIERLSLLRTDVSG
jgi:gentisate 1,2-dioxygenase